MQTSGIASITQTQPETSQLPRQNSKLATCNLDYSTLKLCKSLYNFRGPETKKGSVQNISFNSNKKPEKSYFQWC